MAEADPESEAAAEAEAAGKALGRLIAQGKARVPMGTIRIFGDWFGRPYDNWHRPVDAEVVGSALRVRFDAGEVLTVDRPTSVRVNSSEFRIESADRVVWEWGSYGPTTGVGPRYRQEHRRASGRIVAQTTAPWGKTFTPSEAAPAFELVTRR